MKLHQTKGMSNDLLMLKYKIEQGAVLINVR